MSIRKFLGALGRSLQPQAEKVVEGLKVFAGNPAAIARSDARRQQEAQDELRAQQMELVAAMLQQCRQTANNFPFYHDFLSLRHVFRPNSLSPTLRPVTPEDVGATAQEIDDLAAACAKHYIQQFRGALNTDASTRGYLKAAGTWLFPQSGIRFWDQNICQLLEVSPQAAGSHPVEIATWTLNTAKYWVELSRSDEEFDLGCRFLDLLQSASLKPSQAGITPRELAARRAF